MTEEQFWSGLGDYQERILNIITNLSSKTYVGIVNLKNKQTWWSQRVVDFFGLEKGVFDYAMEKSTVKVHPDDRDKYLKGFSDRMQGKHLNERFEYRLMTGKYTCSLFSAYGQIVQDEQGEPALLVLVAENHGISDEIDSVTGLYSEEVFDEFMDGIVLTLDCETKEGPDGPLITGTSIVYTGTTEQGTFSSQMVRNCFRTAARVYMNLK